VQNKKKKTDFQILDQQTSTNRLKFFWRQTKKATFLMHRKQKRQKVINNMPLLSHFLPHLVFLYF